jgi:hypothetical protein
MLRQRLPLMFIAVSVLSTLAAHAEDRLLLKSVNVDLPVGDRMFEGPGSDVANNNCLACHSAGMVLFQPELSQAQWHAEVEKMRTAYKAPIDPKDVDTIVALFPSGVRNRRTRTVKAHWAALNGYHSHRAVFTQGEPSTRITAKPSHHLKSYHQR